MTQEVKKWARLSNISPSNARKILKFWFQDVYMNCDPNYPNRTYDVTLKKPKDEKELAELKEDIQFFVDYWGKHYEFSLIADEGDEQ